MFLVVLFIMIFIASKLFGLAHGVIIGTAAALVFVPVAILLVMSWGGRNGMNPWQ
jgi:hypothetical protein